MFSTKRNKIKKKITSGEILIEKGLEVLWYEDHSNWKLFTDLIKSFLKKDDLESSLESSLHTCNYFPLRPEPFEFVGQILEQLGIGGKEYFELASTKSKHQQSKEGSHQKNLEKALSDSKKLESKSLKKLSKDNLNVQKHLTSHQNLQIVIEYEGVYLSPTISKFAFEDKLFQRCLLYLLCHHSDYSLRHNTWPLIHGVAILAVLRYKDACEPLTHLLDHPDSFLVEEAKSALYWILTDHQEKLPWMMEQFSLLPHGTIKLQILEILTAFGEQPECYKFLHTLLIHFKKNSDAKYSTQYANILIQRLIMLAEGASVSAARDFFKKNRTWLTDRSLEKLFEVIDQMEGNSLI